MFKSPKHNCNKVIYEGIVNPFTIFDPKLDYPTWNWIVCHSQRATVFNLKTVILNSAHSRLQQKQSILEIILYDLHFQLVHFIWFLFFSSFPGCWDFKCTSSLQHRSLLYPLHIDGRECATLTNVEVDGEAMISESFAFIGTLNETENLDIT